MNTTQGHFWFQYLTTAYVQVGEYEVTRTMLEGKHHQQGIPQVLNKDEVGDAEPYPENFIPEWATTMKPGDEYDKGAYGLGIPVNTQTITAPKVKQVHLLYFYSLSGTAEERTLMQVPATTGDAVTDLGPGGLGLVSATLERIVWSSQEFYEAFPSKGYSQFGVVFPKNVMRSQVHELHSFTGDFVDSADDAVKTLTVYFSPLYLDNGRPLFDTIYLQTQETDIEGDVANIPARLIRWTGGVPSENTAQINRAGDAVVRDGYLYDVENRTVTSPQPSTITIDGVSYTNPDGYNLGYRRH